MVKRIQIPGSTWPASDASSRPRPRGEKVGNHLQHLLFIFHTTYNAFQRLTHNLETSHNEHTRTTSKPGQIGVSAARPSFQLDVRR